MTSSLTTPANHRLRLVLDLPAGEEYTITVRRSTGVTSAASSKPEELDLPDLALEDEESADSTSAPVRETASLDPLARLEGETDLEYVRRLERRDARLSMLVREWGARLHEVSASELVLAKRAGHLVYRERKQTRGGNGHLVSVRALRELLDLFDHVENRGAPAPDWYAKVRTPARQPVGLAA